MPVRVRDPGLLFCIFHGSLPAPFVALIRAEVRRSMTSPISAHCHDFLSCRQLSCPRIPDAPRLLNLGVARHLVIDNLIDEQLEIGGLGHRFQHRVIGRLITPGE